MPFEAPLSQIKRGGGKYCSNRCVGNANKRGVNLVECVCRQCGSTFKIHNARVRLGEGHFCSRLCASLSVRIPLTERFWAHVDRCPHEDLCLFCCWPWMGKRRREGYGIISIDGKERLAHRQSWALHHGVSYPPSRLIIRHLCHWPPCCNPAHLASGTVKDNTQDRIRAGRTHEGEKHPNAKLTDEQARTIYALCLEGISPDVIAAQFGVSRATIFHISRHHTWTHVLEKGAMPIPRREIPRGEQHRLAKFSEAQIKEIRLFSAQGWSFTALGMHYQVSDETIRSIVHRKTWKHVD
jgi:transposase